jgi:hypothetical protein
MFYTIYKITNNINNKFYIGKHQTLDINDSYYGSGKALKKAIKKYGKSSFKKEILFIFDNELEMNDKEKELITEELVQREDTYNMGVGGEGGAHFKGKIHTQESKNKWVETKIKNGNNKCSDELKKYFSDLHKGRVFSEESKRRMSESAKKRHLKRKNTKQIEY